MFSLATQHRMRLHFALCIQKQHFHSVEAAAEEAAAVFPFARMIVRHPETGLEVPPFNKLSFLAGISVPCHQVTCQRKLSRRSKGLLRGGRSRGVWRGVCLLHGDIAMLCEMQMRCGCSSAFAGSTCVWCYCIGIWCIVTVRLVAAGAGVLRKCPQHCPESCFFAQLFRRVHSVLEDTAQYKRFRVQIVEDFAELYHNSFGTGIAA